MALPPNRETPEETAPRGVILPLDIVPAQPKAATTQRSTPLPNRPYSPERQRDWVRLIVACGLLLILGYVVVFATVESTSWPAHWAQAKEMLQIIMPALTGIIGTVIGFYFGAAAAANNGNGPPPDNTSL